MKLNLRILDTIDDNIKQKYISQSSETENENRIERGDAGLDLYCPQEVTIEPGDTKLIDLQIQCEAFSDSDLNRNVSYYLRARSSISKTPLRLANNVGIIDAGYRGNLIAAVDNIKDESFTIAVGQRLFQITGTHLEPIELNIVDSLSDTERGNGGFGSTGQ